MRHTLAALAIVMAAPASAHSWYEARCCSGLDCAPVPVEAVGFGPDGGYRVILRGGVHPMVPEDREFIVRPDQVHPSQDGYWHACITPRQTLLCLYEPAQF